MAAILSLQSLLDSIVPASAGAWLVRISLLAALGCLYLALARRAQPALRHAVAAGSLLAVVLLPAASKLLPAVAVPVLPAEAVVLDVPAVADPAPAVLAPVAHPAVGAIDPAPVVRVVAPVARRAAPPTSTIVFPVPPPAPRHPFISGSLSLLGNAFRSPTHWRRFGLVVWVMVAIGLLIRLAAAFARAHRLGARARVLTADALRVEVERACRVLGFTRRIEVAMSRDTDIPMVVGVARPRIILPQQAAGWSRDRLSAVLLHEIAHIRRRDAVWMLFARIVSASLWFHPLVGMLSRHVRRESERACDDLVLASGVRGSDYAEHLVSIARLSNARDPLAASTLAFAARSTLEQRVASVLSMHRRASSPRLIGALVLASLVAFVTIAAARPTPRTLVCPPDEEPAGARAGLVEPVEGFQDVANLDESYLAAKLDYEQAKQQVLYELAGSDDDDSDDGEEWYDRAHGYYQRGRYEKAGRAYENAARFGYNRATAYYNAGCSYALADQPGPALDALEAALEEGFDDLGMYASDSDLNSLRGDARFQKLMQTVMNSDEGDQRRRAASREYDRLAQRRDVDEGDWNSVGIDLLRAGEYDRAATAFDNEFKASRNLSEDALYNKACARALGGKTDEALKLLEQSILTGSVDAEHMEEDPDLSVLHKNKRFDELVGLANDLQLRQGYDTSWSFNGGKMWKTGDDAKRWKKSIEHYQGMVNRHASIGRAWFNLGYAQIKADRPRESMASFQKALDLGFKPPVMMYNLACANALAGNTDAAFAWLEKSEAEGFEVWNSARWDEDLDSLHADPRWKEKKKQWKDRERDHVRVHRVHVQVD